jgi:competence protein ComEC
MDNPAGKPFSPASRPPLCAAAPLLWSLIPLTSGILIARTGNTLVMAGAIAFCLIMPWMTGAGKSKRLVISLSMLAGIALFAARSPAPDPSWSRRPPRVTRAIIQVEETFNARKPARSSGIGKILQTSLPVDTVRGCRVAFYLETSRELWPGETIECRAVLSYLPAVAQPDDYQLYLKNRDIHLSLNQGEVMRPISPASTLEQLRQRLYQASEELLASGCSGPDEPGNVLASMLLGNRSLLKDERIELYRKTGTYHLFAVSGLHVGSVALCLLLLTRLIPIPHLLRLLPALSGTWFYVWLTGSSPSAVRAGIMITCLSLARVVFRQPHLFPALALSAWLVLLWNPSQLFQLGFQLSYGVVLSIILIGLPLAQHLRAVINEYLLRRPPSRPLPNRLLKLLLGMIDVTCVSLSAGLASMPLIVQHFDLFTPGGVLFGILLNPLATLAVMAGCLTLITGPLIGTLAAGTIAVVIWPVIEAMEWLLRGCLQIPGAVSERSWVWPPSGTCLLVGMLVLAWWLQRLRMRGHRLHSLSYLLPHLLVLAVLAHGSIQT